MQKLYVGWAHTNSKLPIVKYIFSVLQMENGPINLDDEVMVTAALRTEELVILDVEHIITTYN